METKFLYVDMLKQRHAQSLVQGRIKAYQRAGQLQTFDYVTMTRSHGRAAMNKMLINTAIEFQPDLVQFGKCASVSSAAVREIKEATNACMIHFYGDYRPKVMSWVRNIGKYADWTLLYHQDEELAEAHRQAGCKRVGFWWVGADPEEFYPRETGKDYDVIFMANAPSGGTGQDMDRYSLIKAITDEGFQLHLFGRGWKLKDIKNVHRHRPAYLSDFALECSRAKIALGFNTNQVKMYTSWRRVFHSMASGTFFLSRYFPGLETIFENGKHLAWFKSIPEAVELVKYYVEHPRARKQVAKNGRSEVLKHHTWDHRIAELLILCKGI